MHCRAIFPIAAGQDFGLFAVLLAALGAACSNSTFTELGPVEEIADPPAVNGGG